MGMWLQGFGDEGSSDDVGYLVELGTGIFFHKVYCDKHTPGSLKKIVIIYSVLCYLYFRLNLGFYSHINIDHRTELIKYGKHGSSTMPAWQVRTNEVCSGTWSKQGWVFMCS